MSTGRLVPSLAWGRKYVALFTMSAQNTLALWLDFVVSSSLLLILVIIFMELWRSAYASGTAPGPYGLSMNEMLWYVVVVQSLTVGSPRVRELVDEEVRTGSLACHLIRPLNYVGSHFMRYLSDRLLRVGLNLLLAGAVGFLWTRTVPLSAVGVLTFVILLLGGVLLDFAMKMIIALLAFWVENTAPFQFLYERAGWLLGGLLIPVDLLPGVLRDVSSFLPYRYVLEAPALFFVHPEGRSLWRILQGQWALIAVAGVSLMLLFRFAMRRVTIHGG